MIDLQGAQSGSLPTVGGLALADNPFINRSTSPVGRSSSSYGAVMPWQNAPAAGSTADSTLAANTPVLQQNQTLHQIDTMMDALQETTGTWVQGQMQVRGRDGESGLSKLTEAKAPLTFSTVPVGVSRLDLTVMRLSLTSGSAAGDAMRRVGSNARLHG